MRPEVNAQVFVGTIRPTRNGVRVLPRHKLWLTERRRPVWGVCPVGPAKGPGLTTVSRPDAPTNLLAHGLLAYLAHTSPELVMTHPDLAGLLEVDRSRGCLVTSVPDDNAARAIARALPQSQDFVLLRFPPCGVRVSEAHHLIDAGVRMLGCACRSESRPAELDGSGGAA